MSKNNWKKEFKKSIKEIDNIYEETIKELERLHQEKITLIKNYKEKLQEEEIDKLRKNIKEVDNK